MRNVSQNSAGTLDSQNLTSNTPPPEYSLRKGLGFWQITFAGQQAILKHEQGLEYIAWLLLNPPEEPIHGMALVLAARRFYGKPTDPVEIIQQRSLGFDHAEALQNLRRKQQELEAILDDDGQIPAVKEEAARDLIAIYDYEKMNPPRIRTPAQKAVRAVRVAIKRLHLRLAKAVDADGRPNTVLRRFANHIENHILIPSARYSQPGRALARAELAGCFTCEPPANVVWVSSTSAPPQHNGHP